MSFADACMEGVAWEKAKVMVATFGHLAPEPRKVYQGELVFTHGEYGDMVIIRCNFKDLPDSPWFYDHMQDFIGRKAKRAGNVYRFTGTYTCLKNHKGRFSGKVRVVKI